MKMSHMKLSLPYYKLDEKKNVVPATFEEFGKMFENINNRLVRRTTVNDECDVSTVFLGLDHGFGNLLSHHPGPVVFETLVFGGPFDGEMVRYRTWADACEGHQVMVARMRCITKWRWTLWHIEKHWLAWKGAILDWVSPLGQALRLLRRRSNYSKHRVGERNANEKSNA